MVSKLKYLVLLITLLKENEAYMVLFINDNT